MFSSILILSLAACASAFAPISTQSTSISSSALKALEMNGWTPDEKEPCYGLPGAIMPMGFFDPGGFSTNKPLKEVKRLRESEIMHGRVAMMACVGYLAGETVPSPFGVTGPANDQLSQLPVIPFAAMIITIGALETFRAAKGFVEPGADTDFQTIRDTYYPGDLGFDPLGLKPKTAEEFATRQAQEISNGRLAMFGVAGMCAQEYVNHLPILPLQFE